MSELTTLVKPDGTKVKVNQTSLDCALSLGWKKPTNKAKSNGNSKKPRK